MCSIRRWRPSPRARLDEEELMDLSRRDLLALGGLTLAGTALAPRGAAAATPKPGGAFRFRGYTPPHFDPHLTASYQTMINLSFTHSRLLKHKAGPNVKPGVFEYEGDLAERWSQQDDTTYVFKLRPGVKWHSKAPLNGRELNAEDVKYTFDRFLTIKGNAKRLVLRLPLQPDGAVHRRPRGRREVHRPQEGRGGHRDRPLGPAAARSQ